MSDLFRAVSEHNVNRVASILAGGADPNKRLDQYPYWRPLEAVIEEGVDREAPVEAVLEIVRLLIGHGADVNFWYDGRKLTPLLAAMHFPDRALAVMLLEKGADPNVFDDSGFSPLMMAVRSADAGLVKTLLDHGANKAVNKVSPILGFGALRSAIRTLNVPIVKLLLTAGADPHAVSPDGDTPMSAMPKRNESNAVQWDAVAALVAERDKNLRSSRGDR